MWQSSNLSVLHPASSPSRSWARIISRLLQSWTGWAGSGTLGYSQGHGVSSCQYIIHVNIPSNAKRTSVTVVRKLRNETPRVLPWIVHQKSGIFQEMCLPCKKRIIIKACSACLDLLRHSRLGNVSDQYDLAVWRRWREGQHGQIWLFRIVDTMFKKWPSRVIPANGANDAL